jgi:hypothetical protein
MYGAADIISRETPTPLAGIRYSYSLAERPIFFTD